jgi:hypothetical protein
MLGDGKWLKWNNVPLKRVISNAESWIDGHVEKSGRAEVWHKVHDGLSCEMRTPKWDISPDYPNEYPATPYSACRAERPPSNAELIDKLAKATGKDLGHLGPMIVWLDAYSGKNSWRSCEADGKPKAPKPRLGREHTLEDVPHHFFRDQLMQRIQASIPEQDRRAVEKAVFDDLDEEDLDAYAENLSDLRSQKEKERTPIYASDETRRLHFARLERNMSEMQAAVNEIDCDCDLTEHDPPLGRRLYDEWPWEVTNDRSCVLPNKTRTKEEIDMLSDFDEDEIRYDCDQVRAMIARLVTYSDWSIEDFRNALRDVTRKKLIDFLKRRGPREGMKMHLYVFAWEFFRKRELMNIPLPSKPVCPGSNKRKRKALAEQSVNVTAKAPEERDKDVSAVKVSQPKAARASKRR